MAEPNVFLPLAVFFDCEFALVVYCHHLITYPLPVNPKLREFLMSTLSLRMKDENDKHEKIEAVGKRDMGVLLLSLLAKEKAGLELRELD